MSKLHARAAKRREIDGKASKQRHLSKSRACRVPRPGQGCPNCGNCRLDYDGHLQLYCPMCGHVAAGGGFS